MRGTSGLTESLQNGLEMLLLSAIWGASFLFLRVAAPHVGPVAVAAFRIAGAALVLMPLVIWRGHWGLFKGRWPTLMAASLISCVLPFMGLSKAAQTLPAGPLSVLNATTPMWAAVIGWWFFQEPLGWRRAMGLLLGLLGVAWLADHRNGGLDTSWDLWAIGMALGSTWLYAAAIHHSRRYLQGLPPLAVSAGILGCGALLLTGPALWLGPIPMSPMLPIGADHAALPSGAAAVHHWQDVPASTWWALVALAVACTGAAYALFYRLLERVGATRAVSVTFLIPPFAMLWSHVWLNEPVDADMLLGAGVVLLGTMLAALPSAKKTPTPTALSSSPTQLRSQAACITQPRHPEHHLGELHKRHDTL
jgi:drug/metabolite transporter (DMT)-like permease